MIARLREGGEEERHRGGGGVEGVRWICALASLAQRHLNQVANKSANLATHKLAKAELQDVETRAWHLLLVEVSPANWRR